MIKCIGVFRWLSCQQVKNPLKQQYFKINQRSTDIHQLFSTKLFVAMHILLYLLQLRLYSLMNPSYLKKQGQTPSINSFSLAYKNQNNSISRTERKSKDNSLNKYPLAQITNNQPQFKSQKKHSVYDIPLQKNCQIPKNLQKQTSSTITASKWLDSEKEMMEFIMNLKAKKNDQKFSKAKKVTEGFQVDERRQETQQFLCNKMLFIKKIEKLEKEAVSYFYDKDYESCFSELAKAQALIRKQKIQSVQHQLYINYLYSQFYYKLNDNQKWKTYLSKAKYYISKTNSTQSQQLKEYIMNINALEICLAIHEEQYEKVLHLIQDFRCEAMSSKIRRRISHSHITALHKLCKFKQAMIVIDKECEALQGDNQLNNERQAQQIGKLLALKIQMTAQFTTTQRAVQLLEKIIGFEDVANGNASNFIYYHLKLFQLYAQLLKKDECNLLKVVFFYQKWIQMEASKKQKLRIELQLYKLYYDLGVYERALQIFDQISSQNVVYLGPEYLYILASIKHSYGQRKEAVSIMMKIIDLSQDEDSKMLNSYRILQFDLEEENSSLRAERQRILQKCLKTYEGVNHDLIVDLYCEYLKRRGQSDKACILLSKMKKTATFQEFYFNNQKSQRKMTRK